MVNKPSDDLHQSKGNPNDKEITNRQSVVSRRIISHDFLDIYVMLSSDQLITFCSDCHFKKQHILLMFVCRIF